MLTAKEVLKTQKNLERIGFRFDEHLGGHQATLFGQLTITPLEIAVCKTNDDLVFLIDRKLHKLRVLLDDNLAKMRESVLSESLLEPTKIKLVSSKPCEKQEDTSSSPPASTPDSPISSLPTLQLEKPTSSKSKNQKEK